MPDQPYSNGKYPARNSKRGSKSLCDFCGSVGELTCAARPCVAASSRGATFLAKRVYRCTLYNDVFIDDGTDVDGPSPEIVNNFLRAADVQSPLGPVNCVVSNSILVSNPNAKPLIYGAGVTDGGNNKVYPSRAAAFGPDHEFPFLPAAATGLPAKP